MAAYQDLADGNPDGTRIGTASTDLIALHGATPVAQAAFIATVTASTTLSQIVVQVNAILTLLSNKGLMAAS